MAFLGDFISGPCLSKFQPNQALPFKGWKPGLSGGEQDLLALGLLRRISTTDSGQGAGRPAAQGVQRAKRVPSNSDMDPQTALPWAFLLLLFLHLSPLGGRSHPLGGPGPASELSAMQALRRLRSPKMMRKSGCFGRRLDRIGSLSGLGCNVLRRY
ncbi:natriuretic peptides B isoform X2 [Halichoerus grypus]